MLLCIYDGIYNYDGISVVLVNYYYNENPF